MIYQAGNFEVVVIGAGHAGCEAALAAARMGCKTLLCTLSMEHIALMPCNPSIGGPAKAQLVREIDALGGEMAINIDKAQIQMRTINPGCSIILEKSTLLLFMRGGVPVLNRPNSIP